MRRELIWRMGTLFAGLWLIVAGRGNSPASADILAAHFFDGSISRFDEATGAPIAGAGIPSGTAGLATPAGLDIGGDGNLYVSNQFTGEILYFDGSTGAPLPSPLPEGRDGLFASLGATAAPGLIRFGPDGNLYVGNSGNENVQIVDGSTGAVLGNVFDDDTLAAPGQTIGFTFAPNGDFLVGKSNPFANAGTIFSVDASGNTTEIVPAGTGGLLSVNAMLVGPSGELYVADLFGNQILRFDDVQGTNPEQFAVIPPEVPPVLPPGAGFPSNFPSDLAFDHSGNLLVGVLGLTNPAMGGENRGAILRYDLDGSLLETIAIGLSPVSAIALTPELAFGDYNNNGTVEQADLNLVLLNWGSDVAELPSAWVNERPSNGIVDQAELNPVLLNWGASPGARGEIGAVPEPSSWALLLAAAAFGFRLRRKG